MAIARHRRTPNHGLLLDPGPTDPEIKYRDTPARARARARAPASTPSDTRRCGRRPTDEAPRSTSRYAWNRRSGTSFACTSARVSKRDRNRVALANSDPHVIRLADHWIRRFSHNPVRYWLQHHEDQDPKEPVRFWSLLLDVDPNLVSFQRKSNSRRLSGRTWRSERGVLSVRTNDTEFHAGLHAWMDRTRAAWLDSLCLGAWRSLVAHTVWVGEVPGSNPGAPIAGSNFMSAIRPRRAGSSALEDAPQAPALGAHGLHVLPLNAVSKREQAGVDPRPLDPVEAISEPGP